MKHIEANSFHLTIPPPLSPSYLQKKTNKVSIFQHITENNNMAVEAALTTLLPSGLSSTYLAMAAVSSWREVIAAYRHKPEACVGLARSLLVAATATSGNIEFAVPSSIPVSFTRKSNNTGSGFINSKLFRSECKYEGVDSMVTEALLLLEEVIKESTTRLEGISDISTIWTSKLAKNYDVGNQSNIRSIKLEKNIYTARSTSIESRKEITLNDDEKSLVQSVISIIYSRSFQCIM